MKKIIFVTGTDTGVGKTLLASLLLFHLRKNGVRALAMKPFCSGGRDDVRLLQSLQPGQLSDDEMNPFYFHHSLAPAVAAETESKRIRLRDVLEKIQSVSRKCDLLIVEGAGGVLVPLEKKLMVADLIAALNCKVIITSRNQLGTLNHTLLTVEALRARQIPRKKICIALMGVQKPDCSSISNRRVLGAHFANMNIFSLPFFGKKADRLSKIASHQRKIRQILDNLTT